MKCPDCGAESLKCSFCGYNVPLKEIRGEFHEGTCLLCRSPESHHCPHHVERVFGPQTSWRLTKAVGREIIRRIPWGAVFTVVTAVLCLWGIIDFFLSCPGDILWAGGLGAWECKQ